MSLAEVTKRLEAAAGVPAGSGTSNDELLARLTAVAVRLEASAGGAGGDDSAVVADYQNVMAEVKKFVGFATTLGGDVAASAKFYETGFEEVGKLIVLAAGQKKLEGEEFKKLLAPISAQMSAAKEFRDKNRGSKDADHITAVMEGIQALGWVCVAPAPVPYVKEMLAAADFYLNKVLKNFKGDANHTGWVASFKASLNETAEYVKKHHTTGLSWNVGGGAKKAAPAAAAAAAPVNAGGAVAAFDETVLSNMATLLSTADGIGGHVKDATAIFNNAFLETKKLIETASKSKKPAQEKLMPLFGPISAQIAAAKELRDKNRSSEFINHVTSVMEGIGCAAWVSIVRESVVICVRQLRVSLCSPRHQRHTSMRCCQLPTFT
eukprot:TRINITY_DN431_c0_g1_i1.p1 TRINITY_DN431_c0_g1~~TRINITY_DN431_c0_g1_i1.p1  ORF type:complete len:379 (-),score=106.38 TRINITY_DN431_c0_g1_i1:180-1316(-)